MRYITTSRKPCTNSRVFAKDLGDLLHAVYLTRGKSSLAELIATARYNGAQKLFIVTDQGGNPHQILEINIDAKNWEFANTYFVVLHKLRKIFTDKRVRMESISFGEVSRAMHHLLRAAEIYPDDESKYTLIDKDGLVSVYLGKEEVGPKFKIYYK